MGKDNSNSKNQSKFTRFRGWFSRKKVAHEAETDRETHQTRNNDLTLGDCEELQKLATEAPPAAQDPKDVAVPLRNTGVYLWAKGYDVQHFLGAGGFGVVWACSSKSSPSGMKAIKVLTGSATFNQQGVEEEIKAATELKQILEKDTTGKAKKYLAQVQAYALGDKDKILESEVADGDLLTITTKKREKDKTVTRKFLKIDNVLRKARQALKSVKVLHDAGYSHNDIKTENFLRISNWEGKQQTLDKITHATKVADIVKAEGTSQEKVNKITKFLKKNKSFPAIKKIVSDDKLSADKKIKKIAKLVGAKKLHKHRLQLGDYGTITALSSPLWVDGTKEYTCDDDLHQTQRGADHAWYAKNTELIPKRDVYALGVTFMDLLMLRAEANYNRREAISELQTANATKFYTNHPNLSEAYGQNAEDTTIKFLKLIKKMIDKNYKTRTRLDEALSKLKGIR